jgi:modulator of FtsH protease
MQNWRRKMAYEPYSVATRTGSILETNTVLRNTYLLLSLTLLFSAATAGLAMISNAIPVNPIITIVGYFGLLFLTTRLRNSGWGLLSIFALTGFMGYTLGPILNFYINNLPNGSQLVMTSLGATGLIFLGLSAYALTSRKDFSFLSSFLFVGMMVAFLGSLGAMFLHLNGLMLATSAMFAFISSGIILLQTSQIIHGGETNYIMATVTLYVSLYNLFLSLLNLLGMGSRD